MTRRLCLLLSAFCLLIPAAAHAATPPIKHVWVIVLENKDFATTFGPGSQAPYLSQTLVSQGQFLPRYYGTGHESLDNYIAMVSGQPPNPYTQADAPLYADFVGSVGSDGVAVGQGSVYPASVKTVADQLEAKGLTWKGYMEDMKTPCRHPAVGAPDDTQNASATNQYAARHNPFVYFHSIIDRPICQQRDVPLEQLSTDLASEGTTPNFSFITPDLCHDGHDTPCKGVNEPGGLVSADQFLKTWVPRITGSPAFQKDGLLIVNFDESESGADDCCNEPSSPNTPNNGGPTPGNGGGRTGAVLLSPFVRPGVANDTPYNHYSLLRSIEDIFGLDHLAYAARPDLKAFGDDVYNQTGIVGPPVVGPPTIRISGVPRKRCVRRSFKARIRVSAFRLRRVNVMVDRHSVARNKRKRFSVRIKTARLHGRSHRITVRVSHSGAPGRKTVRFRTCA